MATTGERQRDPAQGLPRHRPACCRDEERDIRDTVRAFVRDRVLPNVGGVVRGGAGSRSSSRGSSASSGVLGMHLEGYGCAGASATAYGLACMELEAGDSGVRSLVSVQGSLAMYAIHRWGSEEQKQRWLPRDGRRRGDRLLRPDRARLGLRSGLDADTRAARRQRLDPPRPEDVDHQRRRRRRRGRLGADRRRRPRLPRPEGHQGLHHPGHPPQALAARVGHLRAAARRRAPPGRRAAARGELAARAAVVPERGALRDRLGRGRRGPRLLRGGARLQPRARSSSAGRSRRSRSSSRSSRRWRSRSTARRCWRSISAG